MGLSDLSPDADPHKRHSMIIVPMDAPGVSVMRNLPLLNHHSPEGHTETDFDAVRVPATNLLGEEGAGFALAQARLGPGRIHHCMRSIGQCEVALELMVERALQRKAFGRTLADYANVQDWIAEGRMEIDQARLLCLRAAWMMDTHGNKAARTEVSAIKVVATRLQTKIADRAMQVFGAAGLSNDTPLAFIYSWAGPCASSTGPTRCICARWPAPRSRSTSRATGAPSPSRGCGCLTSSQHPEDGREALARQLVSSYISVMTETTKTTDRLPAPLERFVLQWGDLGGQWGVNRSISQIHAFALFGRAASDGRGRLREPRDGALERLQLDQGIAGLEPDPARAAAA